MKIIRTLIASLCALGFAAADVQAEDWPTRPVTLVVPFNAGGSADRMARGVAPYLSKELGQPVVVENRTGANGQAGTTSVLQAEPDGYTLLMMPLTPYLPTHILVTKAKYTMDDFAYVNTQWIDTNLMFVGKDKPYKDLKEIIEVLKTKPGQISIGYTFGSSGHLSILALLEALGIPEANIRMVSYSGGAEGRAAIAGGQVDLSIRGTDATETVREFVRPVAIFRDTPDPLWDAPPINDVLSKEFGVTVPNISGSARGLATPIAFKKEHPEAFEKLTEAYKRALENPELKEWLKNNEITSDWHGPEESTRIIMDNFAVMQKYSSILKSD